MGDVLAASPSPFIMLLDESDKSQASGTESRKPD
jgi:hypothetical protein